MARQSGYRWGVVFLVIGILCADGSTRTVSNAPLPTYNPPPAYTPLRKPMSGEIEVEGSGVMYAMIEGLAHEFVRLYPGVKISVSAPSSAVVPAGLVDGSIAIGAMSRPLDNSEREAFLEKHGNPVREFCIARDALQIVVNKGNPLVGITMDELDAIYSDLRLRGGQDVQTWGDLGLGGTWQNEPITAYGGGSGWGTTLTFERMITYGVASKSGIKVETIEEGIPDAVRKDLYAIGYTCLGIDENGLKVLPVAERGDFPFIPCTPATRRTGVYPLQRDLYFYVAPTEDNSLNPIAAEFLRFILSQQGQEAVEKSGMTPLDATRTAKERAKLPGAK